MKFPIKTTIALAILGSIGAAGYVFIPPYLKELSKVHFREAEVSKGPIVSMVNATGTVKPVLSISVGSFVSGPILELKADFNQMVKKGDLLAKIDPRLYESNVARDKAQLATRVAEKQRIEALLQQAQRDESRSLALKSENKDFISQAEMDQFKFNRMSLEAQLILAEAGIDQAKASLKNSQANLDYTLITSPVDGIVIDRKIDQGQTLAAQFQTPELFIVAPDMKTKMHIIASVDEADIGLISGAKIRNLPVRFTVDAYPLDLFVGHIAQIRMSSTTTQNVVTYPVVVEAPNNEMKLMPGMTATLSFQVDEANDVLRIPNAALRFYPKKEHVHPDDRYILEGTQAKSDQTDDSVQTKMTAKEKAEARKNRHRRHVWFLEGEFLRAVEVQTGLSDNKYTQLISGGLTEGIKLVTGIQSAE